MRDKLLNTLLVFLIIASINFTYTCYRVWKELDAILKQPITKIEPETQSNKPYYLPVPPGEKPKEKS